MVYIIQGVPEVRIRYQKTTEKKIYSKNLNAKNDLKFLKKNSVSIRLLEKVVNILSTFSVGYFEKVNIFLPPLNMTENF